MTVYGRRREAKDDDGQSHRGKTLAAVASIVVALFGLLSSPVWGPPICQAVGVCHPDAAATTNAAASQGTVGAAITSPSPSRYSGGSPSSGGGTAIRRSTSPTVRPSPSPSPRPKGSGYPYYAGDYCDEFVRAWQDHYQDRAADLSDAQIAATVFKLTPPQHYSNQWGPTVEGAMCTILDTDHGNAQLIQISVTKPTGAPGAITNVKF